MWKMDGRGIRGEAGKTEDTIVVAHAKDGSGSEQGGRSRDENIRWIGNILWNQK